MTMISNLRWCARATVLTLLVGALACQPDPTVPAEGSQLLVGTWGGENAGVLVGDSTVHVHIGCTLGYFRGPARFDADGRFSVTGDYTLRAYPIAIGPSLPARYDGVVRGDQLTLTVVVNDTVEKKTVTLGPAVVTYKREPRMGPCPICRSTMRPPTAEAMKPDPQR